MDNSDADWRTTLRRGDEPLTRRDVAADLALRRAIGRIGVMRQKSKDGDAFHNLQYTKGGRHHVKYVPEAQLAYPPRPKAELPKAGARYNGNRLS